MTLLLISATWFGAPLLGAQSDQLIADLRQTGLSEAPPAADRKLGSTATLEQLGEKREDARRQQQLPKTVYPAAEPRPALKFRFWPKERDLRPGSAQLHFYRALAHLLQLSSEEHKRLNEDWFSENPKTDDEARAQIVGRMHNIYSELHQLAHSEDFEWDHRWRDLSGTEIYMYLLHDVQEARTLARLLALKADDHLARREFEQAINTIRDGYRLAFFLANGETMIQQLVGVAVSSIMHQRVEEALQLPGFPNVYWALATVPRPISNMRRALQIELGTLPRIFPVLEEAATETHGGDYWMERWEETIVKLKELGGPVDESATTLALAPLMFAGPARQRLIDGGMDRRRVEDLPAMQAVFLDAALELAALRDELEKTSLLPYEHVRPLMRREDDEFREWIESRRRTSAAVPLASLLFPATTAAREAELRNLYQHHRLLTIEALRMYAAGHDGRLPDSLQELTLAPALDNPFTGTPFQYHVERNGKETTVVLDGEVPDRMQALSRITLRFPGKE